MQIGPRIRIGGSIGKAGQKLKIGAGKLASKAAPVVSLFNPALGTALGAAGDVLDTSDGAFDFKKAALTAGKNYAIGKAGQFAKGKIGGIFKGGDAASAAGDVALQGGDLASAADPSRFRSVGGFLKDNARTIADYGQMAEGIYDRYQQNQDRKMAEEEYRSLAPLREAAMKGLLDTSRPDVSSLFADDMNPQGRYRRVSVGSRY